MNGEKKMIHLGDITKIDGKKIPFVNCITFGSPCQDLSVAGKRAGLAGKRSSLFMVAVKIIKEMREASGGIYPTFVVWENVPGAFSSNGGEDFRAVLEELARIGEAGVSVPRPASGELSTLNIGERPSVAVESRLSWILEDNAPERYYLSARACQSILNRASRRGKELPEILRVALRGGRAVVLEAKAASGASIRRDRVTAAQMEALETHSRLGALALVVVWLEGRGIYAVPWELWREMKEKTGRASLSYRELEPYRAPLRQGVWDFLGLME